MKGLIMGRRFVHGDDFARCVFFKNADGTYTPCGCGRTYEQWMAFKGTPVQS